MNIIKPLVWDPKGFLQQHIQRDLEQLKNTLGRSADETASVVHLVLCRLLREQGHSEELGMGPGGGAQPGEEAGHSSTPEGDEGEAGRQALSRESGREGPAWPFH